jgi:hypothetical protein
MDAVPPASYDLAPQEPTLGLFLPIIIPWDVERKFWESPVFLSAARDIDALNLSMRTCENVLFLFRSLADIPENITFHIREQCKRNFTFAALHVALKLLFPATYAEWRWGLLSHQRYATVSVDSEMLSKLQSDHDLLLHSSNHAAGVARAQCLLVVKCNCTPCGSSSEVGSLAQTIFRASTSFCTGNVSMSSRLRHAAS